MFLYVLRIIVFVLFVPVAVLCVRASVHLPARGTDDPMGTSRKSLLASGAITVVAVAIAAIGDLVAIIIGSAPNGAFGPLSFIVLDAAIIFLVCRLVYAMGSLVVTGETRTAALVLFALACIYAAAEVTSGELSVAPALLLFFPIAAVGLEALACHAFLVRTADVMRGPISSRMRTGE